MRVSEGSEIIPTRSWQAYSKQVCLWDLAQIICIAFIIQVAWAIYYLSCLSDLEYLIFCCHSVATLLALCISEIGTAFRHNIVSCQLTVLLKIEQLDL